MPGHEALQLLEPVLHENQTCRCGGLAQPATYLIIRNRWALSRNAWSTANETSVLLHAREYWMRCARWPVNGLTLMVLRDKTLTTLARRLITLASRRSGSIEKRR